MNVPLYSCLADSPLVEQFKYKSSSVTCQISVKFSVRTISAGTAIPRVKISIRFYRPQGIGRCGIYLLSAEFLLSLFHPGPHERYISDKIFGELFAKVLPSLEIRANN